MSEEEQNLEAMKEAAKKFEDKDGKPEDYTVDELPCLDDETAQVLKDNDVETLSDLNETWGDDFLEDVDLSEETFKDAKDSAAIASGCLRGHKQMSDFSEERIKKIMENMQGEELSEEEKKQKRIAEKRGEKWDPDNLFVSLYVDEPFYSAISRQVILNRTTDIPTAAVNYDSEESRFYFHYNPIFMAALDENEQKAVAIHEFSHIVYEHVTSKLPEEIREHAENDKDLDDYDMEERMNLKQTKQLWNIAADLSVNSYIDESDLPQCDIPGHTTIDKGIVPGKGEFEEYPPKETVLWYYKELQDDEDIDVSPEMVMDVHPWGGEDEQEASQAKAEAKKIIRESVSEAEQKNDWGSVPKEEQERIKTALQSKIDWAKVTRYFVQRTVKGEKYRTMRRRNTRYRPEEFDDGYNRELLGAHPGQKHRRVSNVAVCVDQSGSVHDKMLGMFLAELKSFGEEFTFDIIPFDTEVDEENVVTYRQGENIDSILRSRRGGTDFDPPTEYVNDHGYDATIFMTDMQAPKPGECDVERLWVIPDNAHDAPFDTHERIVEIPADGQQ